MVQEIQVNEIAFLLRAAKIRIEDPAWWICNGTPGDGANGRCCAVSAVTFAYEMASGSWMNHGRHVSPGAHACAIRTLDSAAIAMGENVNPVGNRPAAALNDYGDHARVMEMFDIAIAFTENNHEK